MEPHVYRNPTTKWVVLVVLAVFAALAIRSDSVAGWIWLVVGMSLVLLLTIRPRLAINDQGAKITNLRSHVVRWPEVTNVGLEGGFWAGGSFLTFHLVNGRRIRAWSVGWNYRTRLGSDWSREVSIAVHNRWLAGRGHAPPE